MVYYELYCLSWFLLQFSLDFFFRSFTNRKIFFCFIVFLMGWFGNSPLFSEATCFLVQNPPIYHSIYKCFFNFDPYIQLQKKSNFMFTEADINKEQDRTDSRRIQCEKVLL